jgi:hypothetical protein
MSINTEKLKKNNRINIIKEEVEKLVKATELDPILITFKSNDMLKEFFMKRFFEILQVWFY